MSAKNGIAATVQARVDASKAKDAAAASFYREDAEVLPPIAETISGWSAIQQFCQPLVDGGLAYNQVHTIEVLDYGDSATEAGTLTS